MKFICVKKNTITYDIYLFMDTYVLLFYTEMQLAIYMHLNSYKL